MFWAFESELQSNPMPFRLQLLWDVTLLLWGRAIDWDRTEWWRWVNNSDPVLRRLLIKVHEILGQRGRPFVLCNAFARLSLSHFVLQIFATKSRSHRKPNKCKSFWPNYSGGRPQLFYGTLLSRFTAYCRQSVVEFRLLISICQAWQWSRKQNVRRVGKN